MYGVSPIRTGIISFTAHGLKECFYPPRMKADALLPYYAQHYSTVEIDGTAYRMPARETVQRWHDSVPADFRFTAKLPQQITHRRRLLECRDYIADFYRALEPLFPKTTALMLQMPKYAANKFADDAYVARLTDFFAVLPQNGPPIAVEIRDPERLTPRLLDALRAHHAALVWVEIPGMPPPAEYLARAAELLPTSLSYIRLMGDRIVTSDRTDKFDKVVVNRLKSIKQWAEVGRELVDRGQDVNVFVSAYYEGNAPRTIARLQKALNI